MDWFRKERKRIRLNKIKEKKSIAKSLGISEEEYRDYRELVVREFEKIGEILTEFNLTTEDVLLEAKKSIIYNQPLIDGVANIWRKKQKNEISIEEAVATIVLLERASEELKKEMQSILKDLPVRKNDARLSYIT